MYYLAITLGRSVAQHSVNLCFLSVHSPAWHAIKLWGPGSASARSQRWGLWGHQEWNVTETMPGSTALQQVALHAVPSLDQPISLPLPADFLRELLWC